MFNVVAILPCRGRKEQTQDCVRRLLATANIPHDTNWKLVLVGGIEDEDIVTSIASEFDVYGLVEQEPTLTYWTALQRATDDYPATHYAMLANDLLPAVNWLPQAMNKLLSTFPDGNGIVGFNGDGHGDSHSAHFIISKELLEQFGGWPVWYNHNFGDTEFCIRAQEIGRYVKAPYAILFHNHPWISANSDDEVYQAGRSRFRVDEELFRIRRMQQWKS